MQVLLQRPSSLEDMVILAERNDQAIMAFRRPSGASAGQPSGGNRPKFGGQRGGFGF